MRYHMTGQMVVKDLQIGDFFCADRLPNVFLQLACRDHKIASAMVLYDEECALNSGESVFLLPSDLVRRAKIALGGDSLSVTS